MEPSVAVVDWIVQHEPAGGLAAVRRREGWPPPFRDVNSVALLPDPRVNRGGWQVSFMRRICASFLRDQSRRLICEVVDLDWCSVVNGV